MVDAGREWESQNVATARPGAGELGQVLTSVEPDVKTKDGTCRPKRERFLDLSGLGASNRKEAPTRSS